MCWVATDIRSRKRRIWIGWPRVAHDYTACWTPSPVCVPARASFATGKYIHQIGFWDNADPYDGSIPSWHHRLRERRAHLVVSIGKLHFRSDKDDCGFSRVDYPMQVIEGKGDLLGTDQRRSAGPRRGLQDGADGRTRGVAVHAV
jgi:choline-sulfatase